MSLTDQKKREIDGMNIRAFMEYWTDLPESETNAVFEYLSDEYETQVGRVNRSNNLGSMSSSEAGKIFDLCEKHFFTLKKASRGPRSVLLLMSILLEERGWSARERDPKQSLKVNRSRIVGNLKQEMEGAEGAVDCATDTMKTRRLMAACMLMSKYIGEYIAWHKREIEEKGEQRENEKRDLQKIEQYMSLYYNVAYEGLFQAFELNMKAKEILTDYGKPDAMQRRTMNSPIKLFNKLPDLSPKELDTLCDDARHNLEISLMDMSKAEQRGEKSSSPLYNSFNDGERAFVLGIQGGKGEISARGLTMMCNACKEGKKDTLYGDLDFTIRGMKKDLADANAPVKDANVGASAFIALLGFALAALMIFVPPVQAFFEGPFFNEPSMVLLAIILIAIGVVALGVGGIPLCALAVVAYLGLTYFLFEVVGFGVILMAILTIAGLVFGVGGLVSMIKDAKKLSEHKRRGPAARAKVNRRAGECTQYIDHLSDLLKQYRAVVEKRPSSDQKKRDLEDLDRLLAYYDMARKQVQELGVEDDDDDMGF